MVRSPTSRCQFPQNPRKRLVPSLERRRSVQHPRGNVLIACHRLAGSYFSGFVQSLGLDDRVTIHISDTNTPVIIVNDALRVYKEQGPFQRLYALVCHEDRGESLRHAQGLLSDYALEHQGIFRMVTSIPSFDLWLLLHLLGASLAYDDDPALASCVRNQLKQHVSMEHLGEREDLFNHLRPGLADAIRRSQTLSHLNISLPTPTPSTEVHEVVSFLLKWQHRLQKLNHESIHPPISDDPNLFTPFSLFPQDFANISDKLSGGFFSVSVETGGSPYRGWNHGRTKRRYFRRRIGASTENMGIRRRRRTV